MVVDPATAATDIVMRQRQPEVDVALHRMEEACAVDWVEGTRIIEHSSAACVIGRQALAAMLDVCDRHPDLARFKAAIAQTKQAIEDARRLMDVGVAETRAVISAANELMRRTEATHGMGRVDTGLAGAVTMWPMSPVPRAIDS